MEKEPMTGVEFEASLIQPKETMNTINDKLIKALEDKIKLQEQMIISLKTRIKIIES